MYSVFIDGREGTTGLRIADRLAGRADIKLIVLAESERKAPAHRRRALNACDAAMLCLPDAAAREAVAMIENPDTIVIDASTAHRTRADWAYGFPEISDEAAQNVRASTRISVPGCHASGFIALLHPLITSGLLPRDALLSCHSLTGFSGGGKGMIADYAQKGALYAAPRAYALSQQHKHLPEMVSALGLSSAPAFLPVVGNFYSGMLVTVPLHGAELSGGIDDVRALYARQYAGPVVRYREALGDGGFLGAELLSGRDDMWISVSGNDERMQLIAVYDNLGKGASGAAVQLLNIKMGADQCAGLNI